MQYLALTQETDELPSVTAFFAEEAGSIASTYQLISPKSDSSLIRYQVVSRGNGFVQFVMSVPEAAFPGFIDTMTAMLELTEAMGRKAKHFAAQNRPIDLKERQEREEYFKRFETESNLFYDAAIQQGMEVNAAIRITRSKLKDKYVFATYEIVKETLRKAGKFQKVRFRAKR